MPRVLDLMEVGFNSIQSKHLGANPELGDFNNLSATGNNSQANAYQLIANYNIFTTVGATTNSCKLPKAEGDPHGIYYILNLGASSLYLFPAVGDSFNDLAANTAIEIPSNLGVILVKQTITSWQVQNTLGTTTPSGGGGGNSVTATLDFGASFTDKAQTVVTGQSWVTGTSNIVTQVKTPSGTDPDEMRLLNFKSVVSDLVVGDGFTITTYSEPEARGTYDVMCIGV